MADISAPPPGLDEYVNSLDAASSTPVAQATPQAPQASMQGLAQAPMDVPEGLDDYIKDLDEEKYGTVPEMAKTFAEGAASSATFGLSTGIEKALGAKDEDIQARRETNPGTYMAGQVAGVALPGGVAGKALGAAGKGVAAAIGLAEPTTAVARIGSAAVKSAVENGLFQAGDDVSKMFSGGLGHDPAKAFETAVTDVGLASVLGGSIGGGLTGGAEGGKALWSATMGKETAGFLRSLSNKVGGIEGQTDDVLEHALQSTGLGESMSPEVKAAMSQDPQMQEMASVLRQTDSNASGLAYQKAENDFRERVSHIQAETMGFKPGELPSKGEIDKYNSGRHVGETLSKELGDIVDPLSKEYQALRDRYASADLVPSVADRAETSAAAQDKAFGRLQKAQKELSYAATKLDPEMKLAAETEVRSAEAALDEVRQASKNLGTTDQIADKISDLAEKEGWTMSPSSDIMREVNRVIKELPNVKTVNELSKYITQVGENTSSKLPFGMQDPVSRAGGLMKRILRDAESDVMGKFIGESDPLALERYGQLRKSYAEAASLKDDVSSVLGLKGSTSGYSKALKAMAENDGEKMIQRLAGDKDAAWLQMVQEKFPATAKAIQEYHLSNLAAAASDGAGGISSKKLLSALDRMSPQLRDFTMSEEQVAKIKTSAALLDRLNSPSHNFSNTARTVDKLLGGLPGSAVGLVTGLLSHNPITGILSAAATKAVGKDLPDAARLALLKFMGTSKPVSATGFKAMVEMIGSTIKGENLIGRATKDIFNASKTVLPSALIPSESQRNRLDKELLKAQEDGGRTLMNMGNDTAHYLPEQSAAAAQTTMNAVNYLNSLRPKETKLSPLDSKPIVSQAQKAKFDRALNIAQQPLVILNHIKQGTLTQGDMQTMRTLYPSLHSSISEKIMAQVSDSVQKGKMIPYTTRMGLSMFLGQPLDSTMLPQNMASIQAIQQGSASAQSPGQPQQGPKRSTAALSKLPGMAQSADQARQARGLKD